MHPFWIITLSLCLFWNTGCSSNKNSSQKDNNLNSQADSIHTKTDTMPKPDPPPPGLPPGQAKVHGELVEFGRLADDSTSSYLIINVEQVLGYGASTPPIGVSDSLKIVSHKEDQNSLKIGKIVSAVISYQQLLGGSGNSTRWTLVKLETDFN